MPGNADQAFNIGLHQKLQHRLGHRAQEVAVAGLLHQLGQCHLSVAIGISLGSRCSLAIPP